jgi:hypothetical protein
VCTSDQASRFGGRHFSRIRPLYSLRPDQPQLLQQELFCFSLPRSPNIMEVTKQTIGGDCAAHWSAPPITPVVAAMRKPPTLPNWFPAHPDKKQPRKPVPKKHAVCRSNDVGVTICWSRRILFKAKRGIESRLAESKGKESKRVPSK